MEDRVPVFPIHTISLWQWVAILIVLYIGFRLFMWCINSFDNADYNIILPMLIIVFGTFLIILFLSTLQTDHPDYQNYVKHVEERKEYLEKLNLVKEQIRLEKLEEVEKRIKSL